MASLFYEHQGVPEFLVLHDGNTVPIKIQTNRKKGLICDFNENKLIDHSATNTTVFLFRNILTQQRI